MIPDISGDIFSPMQSAVDIVGTSLHPSNKVAATIAGVGNDGAPYALSRVNFWPASILEKIGMNVDIGRSSGTVHAETACILSAPKTDGAAMFVTDPPCPNCVKNMVEAGIKKIYIDHKGFDKDFAVRRMTDFEMLSMFICEKSGIDVYKIFRKDRIIEPILKIPAVYTPVIERPSRVQKILESINFPEIIKSETTYFDRRHFAVAVASNHIISAEIHPIAGFAASDDLHDSKYNHFLQPVHRVMMTAARHGFKIDKNFLYSSRVPTAREMVNMIGAGLNQIIIGNQREARDEDGLKALTILTEASILNIQ